MSAGVIFNDTFTEASTNTSLASHTPDTGTSWTQVDSRGTSPNLQVNAANDNLEPSSAGSSRGSTYTANATYGSANYRISFDLVNITVNGSDDPCFVIGRYSSFANNGLYLFDAGNGASGRDPSIYIYTGAATFTQLAFHDNSDWIGLTNGDTMTVDLIGSELIIYKGEVSIIWISDGNITAAGKAGIGLGAHPAETGGDFNLSEAVDNFKVNQIAASVTSFASPTTTGEISNQFTSPSNAYADDASYATDATVGHKQDYGDFGLSIPSGATIVGVQVAIDAKLSSTGYYEVGVEISKDNGANWSTQKVIRSTGTTDRLRHAGHSASLWGLTFADGDFDNDHFRVRLEYKTKESGSARTLSVDHVKARVFYDGGASGDVTINPSVQSAAFSIQAPVVTAIKNVSIAAAVLGLVASLIAPTAILGTTTSPTVQSAAFSIQAPTIVTDQVLSPAAQQVTVAIQAPSVKLDFTVSPTVQSSTFSIQSPIVTIAQDVTASAGVQSATFSIQAPSISLGATASPSAQEVTASIQSPTLSFDYQVTASALSATFSIQAPAVGAGVTTSATAQSATFSTQSVSIVTDQVISPAASSVTLSIPAPSVAIGISLSPSVQVATFSVQSAVVTTQTGAIVQATALSSVFSLISPTTKYDFSVFPSVQIFTFTIQTPTRTGAFYEDKYSPRSSSFNDKYSSRGSSYNDKYSSRGTSYSDKHSSRGSSYSDKYSNRGTDYDDKYIPKNL